MPAIVWLLAFFRVIAAVAAVTARENVAVTFVAAGTLVERSRGVWPTTVSGEVSSVANTGST